MVLADDWGHNDWGRRSTSWLPWATPTLDRLAREGVTLSRHYGASVCAPARACLMTGRSEIKTGFWYGAATLRLDETTLAQEMKRAGCVAGEMSR